MIRFLPGRILRNLNTGQTVLVVSSSEVAITVVDPTANSELNTTFVILPRSYFNWTDDRNIEVKVKKKNIEDDPILEFIYKPLFNYFAPST